MQKLKAITITLVLTVAICASNSSAELVDGLALMKVEHGARAASMGGAFVTIKSDPNATAYNPANAKGITDFVVSFGHNTHWENIRMESGFFGMPLSSRMVWHGGIKLAAIDDLEGRIAPTLEPINNFSSYDLSIKSGISYSINDKLTAGLAMGWFVEKIEAYRGSAFNIDLGMLYDLNETISFAWAINNLGSDFKLEKNGQPGSSDISLPATYRLGGSYKYDKYLGALNLVIVDDNAHIHLGAEANLHELFDLRAGYMTGYDSKDFTAGASFKKRNIIVDYGFVPYGNNLGTSHLFSLTFSL